MRILIATAVYYPQINGVAVFAHNLAEGLARRGHEVLVVAPSLDGKERVQDEMGVKTVYLESTELKFYPDQVHSSTERQGMFYRHGLPVSIFPSRKIRKVFSDFRPDLVHVQVSDPIGMATVREARRRGVPVVTTEHNEPEVIVESLRMPRALKKLARKGLKKFFVARQRKSDFVTMPTEAAIRGLMRGTKKFTVPIAAISNGVDLANFKPGETSAELYRKYGVNEKKLTVLYIGRLDPEKNVETVIRAFIQAEQSLTKAQLVIVGDGVDRARLEKIAEGQANIHFLGRVVAPELYKIYQMGDVFVTASKIETQGIVLIEAAATGLPLIAINAGAVGEVCRNGVNGILCAPNQKNREIAAISDALTTILGDEERRKKFSTASLEIAQEHDFERTLDRFLNIYQKVLNDKVK